ncbi:MAG: alpha/beta hydrolase, partial [Desertifilum sp. SIO1I2]|nr:alpha/beta hydrolase [Desertifilum sp. SIO1I2]
MSLEFISVPRTNSQTPVGLVVCLHGWGANAKDLASFSGELDLDHYQFFFP